MPVMGHNLTLAISRYAKVALSQPAQDRAAQQEQAAHVRFGAKTGLTHRRKQRTIHHLIGAREQRCRNFDAERLHGGTPNERGDLLG